MPLPANEDYPSYRRFLYAARQAALASLAPDDRAAYDRDNREMREITKAKKTARRAQAARINTMIVTGHTVAEISALLGISEKSLWRRRAAWGYALAQRAGFRRLFGWVSDTNVRVLDELAGELRLDRGKLLERLLAATLADGGETARWLLGERARRAA